MQFTCPNDCQQCALCPVCKYTTHQALFQLLTPLQYTRRWRGSKKHLLPRRIYRRRRACIGSKSLQAAEFLGAFKKVEATGSIILRGSTHTGRRRAQQNKRTCMVQVRKPCVFLMFDLLQGPGSLPISC